MRARRDDVRRLFRELRVWQQQGTRAPNKCLLALWAIGRCLNGESRMAPWPLVNEQLGELLREFGPQRKVVHTEQPFWRLRKDGVWTLEGEERVTVTSKGDPHTSALLRDNVHGGLSKPIYDLLRADRLLAADVARDLLAVHFDETLHDDILLAVDIDPHLAARRKPQMRAPRFREAVLRAYERRCAVCGFDVRIDARTAAIDAAYIRWQQAEGPDDVQNGIALCVLHHKLFHKGAFTLSPPTGGSVVLVSKAVAGATGVEEWLGRYHRQAIRPPVGDEYRPDGQHVDWHAREVFRRPQRP